MKGNAEAEPGVRVAAVKIFLHLDGRFQSVRGFGKGGHHRVSDSFHNGAVVFLDAFIGFLEVLAHLGESRRVPLLLVKLGGAHQIGKKNGLHADLQFDIRRQGFGGEKIPEVLKGE